MQRDKISRGNAGQFFVAGELCRRGLSAIVTLGNTPNVDVTCSNEEGTRFAHIQVKTFVPGAKTCSVGIKAACDFGRSFFWVLAGIPTPTSPQEFQYFIIPSCEMARRVKEAHELWLKAPGQKGQPHKDNKVRIVHLPPHGPGDEWDISSYQNRWDLIEKN
jgi:hypothetical protein